MRSLTPPAFSSNFTAMTKSCLSGYAAALIAAAAFGGQAPKPPEQPKSGPGGSDYAHQKVVSNTFGKGDAQYWLFEPSEPTPRSAPLVVFNHGWLAMDPAIYLGWIEHIVRRGRIVIFPRYQAGALTPPWTFARNAIQAVKLGIEELKKPGHVAPDTEQLAIVGHSAGGAITADLAALAAAEGLPKPKAAMIVQPGRGMSRPESPFFPAADYGKIPKDTLMLVVVGADDLVVGEIMARDVFARTPQIPPERKSYIVVQTDRHGAPPLLADHLSPCSPVRPHAFVIGPRIDALDFYAYWKLFDALADFAFHGKNNAYALGNTPEQRFMGKWSDGTPVKELLVKEKP
jgi:acetyl esterase/lipase